MKDLGTIRIETERLVLRKFKVKDYNEMFENWASDERVTKYLPWPKHDTNELTKSLIKMWVEDYSKPCQYNWIIQIKESGKLIGSLSCPKEDNNSVYGDYVGNVFSLGYCFAYESWGKGYAFEACKAVVDFMLNSCQIDVLVAKHHIENIASGKILTKLGMRYIGDNAIQYLPYSKDDSVVCFYEFKNENHSADL